MKLSARIHQMFDQCLVKYGGFSEEVQYKKIVINMKLETDALHIYTCVCVCTCMCVCVCLCLKALVCDP